MQPFKRRNLIYPTIKFGRRSPDRLAALHRQLSITEFKNNLAYHVKRWALVKCGAGHCPQKTVTVVNFFEAGLAQTLGGPERRADVIAANNVVDHAAG